MSTSTTSTAIYVGDLDRNIAEKVLFDVFSKFGHVISTRVCRDSMSRESLGYGYVNFNSHEAAADAVNMPHIDINGKTCRVSWSIRDPAVRKAGANNVFVSNLPESFRTSRELQDLFSAFGNITSAKLATNEAGVSKGYAYVDFESNECAREAISKLNEAEINGKIIKVQPFMPLAVRAATVKWTNVFVKNIPLEWSEEEMKAVFEKYGPITSLVISHDEEGKSKGHGFVNFEKHEDALKAVEGLHDQVLEGDENKKFYVARHQKKEERRREMKLKTDAEKAERSKKFMNMNLYVRNISDALTDDQFREVFSPYGKITSARIMRDPSGASRGFGFVCYTTPEEAQKAIAEMNTKQLGSKPLYVRLYEKKENRIPLPPMGFAFPPYGYPTHAPYMAAPGKVARNTRVSPRVMQMPPNMAMQAMPTAVPAPTATTIKDAKNHYGSIIYPIAFAHHNDLAGKLTGMLLELEIEELTALVHNNDLLLAKLMEAKGVLTNATAV